MGEIYLYYCDGCPRQDFDEECCPVYDDNSWVHRRKGCPLNTKGASIIVKTRGQKKQGRKLVKDADLTNAGLFPEWNGIGVGWKSNVELSKKVGNQTPGRDKPFGKANFFARYCAKYSRARFHRDYLRQCAKWAKATR
ncbi:MAG: hypothetical protein ACW99G_05085 [Candidatus Thorarchaeota archaeon]|jgi:hypothetical protein